MTVKERWYQVDPVFNPVVGIYDGLFSDTGGVAFQSSGFFHAMVTAKGTVTAKFQPAGKSYSLRPSGFAWTGSTSAAKILKTGDLVTVTFQKGKDGSALQLENDPREQASVLILENSTGAVRAASLRGGPCW